MTDNSETAEAEVVLIPVEERQVDFYDDRITAALVEIKGQTQIYVPIRPLCDYLGLSWSGQRERILRNPVLSKSLITVRMTRTMAGRSYDVAALPIEYLPGWLFGIEASRVKAELQEKVVLYQAECFRVLWQAFQAEALGRADQAEAAAATTNTSKTRERDSIATLQEIRATALAVAQLAGQQIELEGRVAGTEERLNRAAQVVRDLQNRVTAVEGRTRTTPPSFISEEQAAQVSNTVRALGQHLVSLDPDKGNVHYNTIFSAIYKLFNVSEYRRLRQGQFESVMGFLEEWRRAADTTGNLTAPPLPATGPGTKSASN